MSIALTHTGLVHLETGQLRRGARAPAAGARHGDQGGDRRCLLHAAINLALAYSRHGEHRPALVYGRRAFEVAQEIGFRQTAGVVVGNMGEIYRDEGDYVRATRCFAYALRIAIDLRDWTSVADQVANAATVAAAQGRDREAERLFDQAIALARHLDAPYLLCVWLHRLATLHVDQGRFDGGRAAEPGGARHRRCPRRAGHPGPGLRPRAAPAGRRSAGPARRRRSDTCGG